LVSIPATTTAAYSKSQKSDAGAASTACVSVICLTRASKTTAASTASTYCHSLILIDF
jgi:hypothetical protein